MMGNIFSSFFLPKKKKKANFAQNRRRSMGLTFKHFFNHTKLSLFQGNENQSQRHNSICAHILECLQTHGAKDWI